MTIFYKEISKEMEYEQMSEVDEDMEESSTDSNEEDSIASDEVENNKSKIYLPGKSLECGEELIVDKTAYRMLHHAQSGAPCLSFDIILDDLGNNREDYPLNIYLVAGTQAAKTHVNNLLVMKMKNLCGIEDNSDDESDDDELHSESDTNIPILSVAPIKHQGCVNRVRYKRIGNKALAASWSELGRVHIWDLDKQLNALDNDELLRAYNKESKKNDGNIKPLFSFKGHLSEGYGLDWCPTQVGMLASGDCKGNIHIWHFNNSSTWHVDQRPYNSHAPYSVEDIQWSPNERHVLASCSVDKSIKIWDTRASPQSACMLTAASTHTADVNVISWNCKESQFLVSGGDDGLVCIWDLRQFSANNTRVSAIFKQHTAPVTTVEWHPQEATVFASGGADDQIAQWDLSIEVDPSEEIEDSELKELPPQLLFIHQGQTDIKELHWHPQCPGTVISTAHSGFNVFRTISV
ncbi:WD repeat-containing protein 1 l(2)09851 [Bombus vancouverensis nearcticus]|uniref:WD repeat-containing protein 1 l(2)09851 n=1 Tax=Bombus vancouverensis nearcticus TaxID=2705178 RepID=UPI001438E7D3|nr:glutamate-rich WD repeat-containing protein 1 [Bombus vancouverensis nearcticus]XP_033192257.1 glutamate-rich WD repeat-containing protein 1 [Bombus vancouverensis nearcticus]